MLASLIYPASSDTLPGASQSLLLGPDEFWRVSRVQLSLCVISLAVFIVDYLQHLADERRLLWPRRHACTPLIAIAFLVSRYLTLGWLIFAAIVSISVSSGSSSAWACSAIRFLPLGYSAVGWAADVTLILRTASLFVNRRRAVLIGLFALLLPCIGVQVAATLFVQPLRLSATRNMIGGASLDSQACILVPTSIIFIAGPLASTLLHHVMLGLTVVKSWRHFRATGSSLARALLSDSVELLLFYCLANFATVVLVCLPSDFLYKLVRAAPTRELTTGQVNLLPAMVAMHLLLAKIIFRMKRAGADSRSTTANLLTIELPPLSPTSDMSKLRGLFAGSVRSKTDHPGSFVDFSRVPTTYAPSTPPSVRTRVRTGSSAPTESSVSSSPRQYVRQRTDTDESGTVLNSWDPPQNWSTARVSLESREVGLAARLVRNRSRTLDGATPSPMHPIPPIDEVIGESYSH